MKLLLVAFATFTVCNGLKILNIFPTVSKSHDNLGKSINMHLLKAGHEVTYMSPFVKKSSDPNFRFIDISANLDILPTTTKNASSLEMNAIITYEVIMLVMHVTTTKTVENENVQRLLRDPDEHFDVVIVDWMFNEIVFSGIASIYDAPLIWVSTLDAHWGVTALIDEPLNPAYNSDPFNNAIPPLSFWQRAWELFTQIRVRFLKETIFHFFDSRAYNNLIAPIIKSRGKEPPAPQDLRYNASLFLSNSHVSFGEATRLPINYIPVGGFHIQEDVKPLPEDIKSILDNAKHGVIYFSLGSLIQSKDLKQEVKRSLLDMFGTLKQTIIWKFEEELTNLPKNVHILKWAPQQSILNHPNCILFITQGGLLSTTEAIHFAVPIIGMPVFADQFANIEKAVRKGFAKKVDLIMSADVADNLKEAIAEVLENPKYKEKIQELSFIFHHRPLKPGAELIHWVEHVAKTRGALHMRSPALKVSWYQKMYLDLAALIVFIAIALRIIYRKIRGSKDVHSTKKKN